MPTALTLIYGEWRDHLIDDATLQHTLCGWAGSTLIDEVIQPAIQDLGDGPRLAKLLHLILNASGYYVNHLHNELQRRHVPLEASVQCRLNERRQRMNTHTDRRYLEVTVRRKYRWFAADRARRQFVMLALRRGNALPTEMCDMIVRYLPEYTLGNNSLASAKFKLKRAIIMGPEMSLSRQQWFWYVSQLIAQHADDLRPLVQDCLRDLTASVYENSDKYEAMVALVKRHYGQVPSESLTHVEQCRRWHATFGTV